MSLMGTTLPVFLGLTVGLCGAAAWMMGQALGQNWRPRWQLLPYSVLLAGGDRFLDYALFRGGLLSPGGYLLALLLLWVISVGSYSIAEARSMVRQYPWLYERAGPFGWRKIS